MEKNGDSTAKFDQCSSCGEELGLEEPAMSLGSTSPLCRGCHAKIETKNTRSSEKNGNS